MPILKRNIKKMKNINENEFEEDELYSAYLKSMPVVIVNPFESSETSNIEVSG